MATTKAAAKAPRQPAADPRGAGTPPAGTPPAADPQQPPAPKAKRAALAEDMVSVTVPRAFKLTRDDGSLVEYAEGIYDMPKKDAEHFYAKANGVEPNDD